MSKLILVFLMSASFSISFGFELQGSWSSFEFDGKQFEVKSRTQSRTHKINPETPGDARNLKISAAIIESYVNGGGRIEWPDQQVMTEKDLVKNIYLKRDQILAERSPTALLPVIARLEADLMQAMVKSEKCANERAPVREKSNAVDERR